MSGTPSGGKLCAQTNKARHGDDFYVRLGKSGGQAKVPKGFALMDPVKLSAASSKGGRKSRRGPKV